MKEIEEYFTPTKLAELNTAAGQEIPAFIQGGGWDANRARTLASSVVLQANQKLDVYNAREKLEKLSEMIEELKGIESKVEEIHNFINDNNLDSMVSFCTWSDPMSALGDMLKADVGGDAVNWMNSNHSC